MPILLPQLSIARAMSVESVEQQKTDNCSCKTKIVRLIVVDTESIIIDTATEKVVGYGVRM